MGAGPGRPGWQPGCLLGPPAGLPLQSATASNLATPVTSVAALRSYNRQSYAPYEPLHMQLRLQEMVHSAHCTGDAASSTTTAAAADDLMTAACMPVAGHVGLLNDDDRSEVQCVWESPYLT